MSAPSKMLSALAAVACVLHGAAAQSTASSAAALSSSPPLQTSVSQVVVTTLVATPSGGPSALVPSQAALPPTQPWCPRRSSLLQTLNLAGIFADPKTIVDKPTSKTAKTVLADFAALPGNASLTEGAVVSFAFAGTVHGFWTQLVRGTNASALCDGVKCVSTLIPLNHTLSFLVRGRFREQYYWDSFWIVEGLLASELFSIANDTLQNFMDEIERFGFIPNGGRIYYLNRSQPPLFIQMLARYVAASNDTAILTRALPLAEPALNSTQSAALYAELASGAETGWDYSARWLTNSSAGLRALNVKQIVPVDLNSILYKNRVLMAQLYGATNATAAARHAAAAAAIKAGVLDLFWDGSKLAFYDFNLAANARNTVFSAATFYPFWSGIVPPAVAASAQNAFGAFAALNMVLNRYNGTLPVTFIETGLQWDAPNAWPPHQYIALEALRALPANVTGGAAPAPAAGQGAFSLVPAGQLGVAEAALPVQNLGATANASTAGAAADVNRGNGTVVNGGNATAGGGWAEALRVQLANRYVASVLCSWHATGGSIPGVLPRLSDAELNVTQSTANTGNFSISDIDSAGQGGEYTVQAGFGWTNGVLLWVASNYGGALVAPQCPPLLALAPAPASSSSSSGTGSATATAPTGSGSASGGSSTGAARGLGAPVRGALGACALAYAALLL
ncbi:Six-hairpin glycosidase-like protein [Mycena rosella]|uniref:Trehalase n=1 Tax=Mycena rosella TaxID=1033263 RepID=A0AAD7CS61_MYCRO|nr:Six-hairpin glycosidase-like protein [Mycena rosella]